MKTKLFFLACFALANALVAQSFDTTFGTNGKLQHADLGEFYFYKDLADGKSLALGSNSEGNAVAVKFFENGTLDPNFGTGGKLVMDQFPGADHFEEFGTIQELPNGKLLIGYAHEYDNGVDPDFFETKIIRLNANGSIDPSFNNPAYSEPDNLFHFAVLPSGKILAQGWDFLRRFNADGSLDTTYGNNGTRVITFESSEEFIQSGPAIFLLDDTNNRIVKLANEESTTPVFYQNPAININYLMFKNNFIYALSENNTITKLNTNLVPVSSYGVNGTANLGADFPLGFNDLLIQPNGSIINIDYETNSTESFRKIYRITPNGTLDATFGSSGHYTYPFIDAGYSIYYGQSYLNSLNGKLYIADYEDDPGNGVILSRFVLPAEALGVSENAGQQKKTLILENPVTDNLLISEGLTNAEIYSSNGAKVGRFEGSSVSVKHLSPGMYFVKGANKKGENVQLKFIKK